jgi:proliferating cell nuclear antigen
MSVDNCRQTHLLGEPDDDALSIDTSGRVIRPALALPSALVDECRLHCTPDGISVAAVDPANVSMVEFDLHAAACDRYQFDAEDAFAVGIYLDGLTNSLRQARKGKRSDDPVSLDIDEVRTIVAVERDYDTTTLQYADEQLAIDPQAIREDADLPTLDLSVEVTVDVTALKHAVEHINAADDHLAMRLDDGALAITGGNHEDSPAAYSAGVRFADTEIDVAGDPAEIVSIYSMDYIVDIVGALKTALIDEVTIRFGQEFPASFEYERTEDGTTLYSGRFAVAPRIGSDS